MDRDLAELQRAHEEDPADVELARRFEVALLRAGLQGELRARYRRKFSCPHPDATCRLGDRGARPAGCDACGLTPLLPRSRSALEAELRPGVILDLPDSAVDAALELLLERPAFHLAEEQPRSLCIRTRDREYGLVLAGLSVPGRRDAAIRILCDDLGMDAAEAEYLCSRTIVPVLKGATRAEAEALAARFRTAQINTRMTTRLRQGWS